MRENRLIYKIGGPPHAIRDANDRMALMQKEQPETAAAAMASAVPKAYTDRGLDFIKKMAVPGYKHPGYSPGVAVETYQLLCDPRRCWTLKAIAGLNGVYEQTFYEWIKKHEELQFAIQQGKATQEVNFGSMLLHGFKYSSGVEFILTNLHNWTLKQKTEHVVDLNAAIAAQERAKREQGIVWDDESAQKPTPLLVRQSPKEDFTVREDDADYKGANDE